MTHCPHFAFPFRFDSAGSSVVVDQDSPEEVEQNVLVLMLTDEGERVEVPSFGIRDLIFQVDFDTQKIVEAARKWDERAALLIDVRTDFLQGMVRDVRIGLEEE